MKKKINMKTILFLIVPTAIGLFYNYNEKQTDEANTENLMEEFVNLYEIMEKEKIKLYETTTVDACSILGVEVKEGDTFVMGSEKEYPNNMYLDKKVWSDVKTGLVKQIEYYVDFNDAESRSVEAEKLLKYLKEKLEKPFSERVNGDDSDYTWFKGELEFRLYIRNTDFSLDVLRKLS